MGAILSRPSNWITVDGTCYELGHTWSPSCMYSSVELFMFVLHEAVKIYLPLYLLSDILRRTHPLEILKNTPKNVLRSSLFLAINGGGFVSFICILRKLIGRFYFLTAGYFPALFASFCAIITERKSRRGMLSSYVGTIGIETLYRMIKYRGYITPLPYGEVFLFCFASAILLYNFRSKGPSQDVISSLLSVLFKPKVPLMLRLSLLEKSNFVENTLSFILETALVSVWSFGLGYSLQATLNAVQLGHRIIKDPSRIKQAWTKPYNIQFGKFLASFTILFKVSNALLFLSSLPRDIRLLVSGLIAGLSMLYIRSNGISLYVTIKALEVLYFKAVDKGILRSYYYGDTVLYAIFTAVIFHAVMFEAHNIRLSYWRFVDTLTKGRIRQLNYDVVDQYGTDASQLLRMINAQEQMERNREQRRQQQQQQQQN